MSLPKHIESVEERRARWRTNARRWRTNNPDYCKAYSRTFRKNNPDRVRAYRKSYNEKNPERVLELRKLSHVRRRKKISESNHSWYLRNKSKVRQYKNHYERERCKTNPSFKIEKRLRNRIVEVLKYQSAVRSARVKELIGCDRPFLVRWIEDQFQDGMTWGNHGNFGWHIDHIKPCASFNLSDSEQQKQCFHYTNLQPLWEIENRVKGDKWH